jgi:hypothetical protein
VRHELYLARVGFAALVCVCAVSALAGWAIAGRDGALSAAIGAGLVAANHAVAVASTSWARVLKPSVLAVGYSVFVVRMLLLLGIFGSLQSVGWIHGTLLAASFAAALVLSLAAECVSYARGSYVPAWMRTRPIAGPPLLIGRTR